jgi:lipoprotein-releasing system ATP-binding protein
MDSEQSLMLQLLNISKSYGDLPVLQDVSLTIESSKVTCLIGPSGAGKSTLLHIAGTLMSADAGTVLWDGVDVFQKKEKDLSLWRNESIGFIFQFHHLLSELTALENVMLPAYISKKKRPHLESEAKAILERVGLSQRMKHVPAQLSGGEQQRVAVARALINHPKMILADEPSGNLDSKNAHDLHNLFFELSEQEGQGFLVVTHNEALAERSHHLIELQDGKIFQTRSQ